MLLYTVNIQFIVYLDTVAFLNMVLCVCVFICVCVCVCVSLNISNRLIGIVCPKLFYSVI